ncbi:MULTISPECIES: nucleotidyltransferase family protein [Citrobacter]|uniref:nucleotidyltransferase family protein n=1 Tax=Citrobacter TaxID=544 RepID=UPI0015E9B671|nr:MULTISPECIES: nucleotidyltransferase family protein [Citrobacter]EHG7581694.1 CBS domain-containing protein [Citrobacter sedlakii]EIQ7157113.1 nucleotidyltransferase family protein [Citrobacter sedlakii]MBN6599243.1 nucleotidyltransferase family protein [Citrobacter sedlakii]QMK45623.1 CBS domain-containing protein [Citrobacter sp. RHB21-C05]QMK64067.1 CBS domain-containing protein [Citrobacter sp. RHB21-C01]
MTQQWKKVLISPDSSILDALEIINKEALRIALVVNEKNELLGVITDGDIRRGLLKNLPLSTAVRFVMNENPITAMSSTSKKELTEIMSVNGILSIPIIDAGIIIGLETIASVTTSTKYDNPIFIMAGGFGTRLRPLTDNCPKPMLKVGDKPILETVIKSFVRAGFSNFYISTHFLPEVIQNHFGDGKAFNANITYIHEEIPLGTGGALGLLPENLSESLPLIMINGDVLTNIDFQRLLAFHNSNNADATICVREYDYQIPYGVITGEGNKITSMVEKPVHHFFVNAGIYVVSPSIFKSVPKNHRIDMPTLLEQHMKNNRDILMFPVHEYWLDIGRMDDFKRAQVDIHSLGLD